MSDNNQNFSLSEDMQDPTDRITTTIEGKAYNIYPDIVGTDLRYTAYHAGEPVAKLWMGEEETWTGTGDKELILKLGDAIEKSSE